MKKNNSFILLVLVAGLFVFVASSCSKETTSDATTTPVFPLPASASFTEEFDNIGDLSGKGWSFVNNSFPIGSYGWRQGRYEPSNVAQYKFLSKVPFLGFPAYSATASPNDFISCDVGCLNGSGNISCWLISPKTKVKNGDTLRFYTRVLDDSNYPIYTTDRLQIWMNTTDGTTNVGNTDASTGSFTKLIYDINSSYIYNDNGGYPYQGWARATFIISGLPTVGVPNARFGFRYFGVDCGLDGGSTGNAYPSVLGIDKLSFISK